MGVDLPDPLTPPDGIPTFRTPVGPLVADPACLSAAVRPDTDPTLAFPDPIELLAALAFVPPLAAGAAKRACTPLGACLRGLVRTLDVDTDRADVETERGVAEDGAEAGMTPEVELDAVPGGTAREAPGRGLAASR